MHVRRVSKPRLYSRQKGATAGEAANQRAREGVGDGGDREEEADRGLGRCVPARLGVVGEGGLEKGVVRVGLGAGTPRDLRGF